MRSLTSGSQGNANLEKSPQNCQEDQNQPQRAKGSADRGPRARWHKAEQQEHQAAREGPPSALDEPKHDPTLSRIVAT